MSPTKKAKARQQWQGTKTPSGDRMEKKTLGEPRLSRGPMKEQCDSGSIIKPTRSKH